MSILRIGIVAAACVVLGFGESTSGSAQKPEEEVKAVALEINQAFVRNDYEGVMKHIAEDITWFSHTNTRRQDGIKIFGESMKKTIATKKTLRWHEYDIVVQVFGNAAIVSFLYDHEAMMGDRKSSRLSRATYGFAKRGGKWMMVHDHSSAPLAS